MTAGGPPVIGSIEFPATGVNTPVVMSNLDNTNVLGWRWDILDAPEESPTLIPLPPPTFAATRSITPDVVGHTILVRLTTYRDALRTIVDDTDMRTIKVRYAPPFDWVIPAASETVESDLLRGWATKVNRLLRDANDHLHDFSIQHVLPGQFLHVRPGRQMLIHGVMTVDGLVQNDGDISFV